MSSVPTEFTFNGLTATTAAGYSIFRAEGLDSPPIRTSQANLTDRDGGNIWSQRYGMRTIVLEGVITGTSVNDYFAKKRALINTWSLLTNQSLGDLDITMWDNTQRTIEAKVVGGVQVIERTGRATFNNFRVSFRAPNPFFKDINSVIQTTALPILGGAPVAFPIPRPIGPATGGSIAISNTGDVNSFASFKISGDVTDATILNSTTGQSFRINGNIGAGDYVRVFRNQEGLFVLKNDVTNVFSTFTGTFFEIVQGVNVIKFSSTASGAGALLESTFTNAYKSI